MNEELIRKELEEHGIDDNLFDLALYYSIEIARYVAFSCNRYRNKEVPENIYTRKDQLDPYIDRLCYIYDILDSLSSETVSFLRETNTVVKNGTLEEINGSLLNMQRDLDTKMNHIVPCRDIDYERIRLGEDSGKYKRLLYLRKVVDENEFLSNEYFCRLVDILNHGRKVIEYQWCTELEYDEKYSFIQTHNLCNNDIEYMISYIEKVRGDNNV